MLGQFLVEDRVTIPTLVDLRPNGVLHDRGPRLVGRKIGKYLIEIWIHDRQRFHEDPCLGAYAGIDKLLDLDPDFRPVDLRVIAHELGAHAGTDPGEAGKPVQVGNRPRVGQEAIQYLREPALVCIEAFVQIDLEVPLGGCIRLEDGHTNPPKQAAKFWFPVV